MHFNYYVLLNIENFHMRDIKSSARRARILRFPQTDHLSVASLPTPNR
jgi:hypothetical protein